MTYEEEVKLTKECRKSIDDSLQLVKSLPKSRETSLSITNVQQGIMWLGMHLKELGTANPYPESYNSCSTKIEPTADGLKL
jgi:hypothetical protein